jgi:hypothetical protein
LWIHAPLLCERPPLKPGCVTEWRRS